MLSESFVWCNRKIYGRNWSHACIRRQTIQQPLNTHPLAPQTIFICLPYYHLSDNYTSNHKIRPNRAFVRIWQDIFLHSRSHTEPLSPSKRAQKTDLETLLKHVPTHCNIESLRPLHHQPSNKAKIRVVTRWQYTFLRSRNHAEPLTPAKRAQKTDLETLFNHLPTHRNIDSMAHLSMHIVYRVSRDREEKIKKIYRRWRPGGEIFWRGHTTVGLGPNYAKRASK